MPHSSSETLSYPVIKYIFNPQDHGKKIRVIILGIDINLLIKINKNLTFNQFITSKYKCDSCETQKKKLRDQMKI